MISHTPERNQVEQFQNAGFVVLSGILSGQECGQLRQVVQTDLDPLVGPAEFEADVGYPGAPANRDVSGGDTPRRLLHAYARNDSLKSLAQHPVLDAWLRVLLD